MLLNVIFYIFCICFAIQSLYLLCWGISITSRKIAESVAGELPPISVIACARNELENLKILLSHLNSQVYPTYEIVVVNDRSDDGTWDYLRIEETQNEKLKVVTVEHLPDSFNGKKYALSLGIKAAKHEHLLLTDADCLPNSDHWIATMARGFYKEKEVVLGFSQYQEEKSFLNRFLRYETLHTGMQYLGMEALGMPYMGVGRNLAYRKSLFMNNKGFMKHMKITGGDDDLFINAVAHNRNTESVLGPTALTLSVPKSTWKAFFRQKIRHLSVGKHYRRKDKIILGIFSLTKVLFWILGMVLALLGTQLYLTLGSLVVYMVLLQGICVVVAKKFGIRAGGYIIPILDIVYILYFVGIGAIALFSKRIRWS